MSYSKWVSSDWYTYWWVTENHHRREQIFNIHSVISFVAGEIANNIDKCLDTAVSIYLEGSSTRKTREELRDELRGYMIRFINDVNDCESLTGNILKIKPVKQVKKVKKVRRTKKEKGNL